MAADPSRIAFEDDLSEAERRALLAAATWYAKYHEQMIAQYADDESALGVTRREHFEHLHGALRKLGVKIRRPHGLQRNAS